MNLTLEALRIIDAIDRKGSFAAAAVALDRVPSAMTYSVRKLEEDLGGANLVARQNALLELRIRVGRPAGVTRGEGHDHDENSIGRSRRRFLVKRRWGRRPA